MQFGEELFGAPQKLVMDPVHGGIYVFDHELKVIDHPLFQRLRFVLQNDMLFLVFPGATHTRFQHSIGAMHVAGKLFKSIVRSYLADPKRISAGGVTIQQQDAIQYFHVCLRLAALLHDAGHPPFSHQFEHCEEIKRILSDASIFNEMWPNNSWQPLYTQPPASLTHEYHSAWCANEILRSIFHGENPVVNHVDVLCMMEKTKCEPSTKFKEHAAALLPLFLRRGADKERLQETDLGASMLDLFRNILSGELDVDKMDYLLRDSYFSGCKYGVYNLDHLISTMRVGFDLDEPWIGLAITEKGLGPLEDFVNARFQLYLQVYNHKTVVGFKWLLKEALSELLKEEVWQEAARKALSNQTAFSDFTDCVFWEGFREKGRLKSASACARLLARKKLTYLRSERDPAEFRKRQTVKELEERRGKKTAYWESEAKFSKISGTYEKLRLLMYDRVADRRWLDEIKTHSRFFEKFRDTVISHFYENPLED